MAPVRNPPPVIDSARTLLSAVVDDDVVYTDRINLFVGDERLGPVECLAICENYAVSGDILLCFCDADWQTKGCIAFKTVEEAKGKAERGYQGISAKWRNSEASPEELDRFLREDYEVDPTTQWWRTECSFCGKDSTQVEGMIGREKTLICHECIREFHGWITADKNAGDQS